MDGKKKVEIFRKLISNGKHQFCMKNDRQLCYGEKCEIEVDFEEKIRISRYISSFLISFRLDLQAPKVERSFSAALRDTDVEKFEKLCFTKSPLSLMAIGH